MQSFKHASSLRRIEQLGDENKVEDEFCGLNLKMAGLKLVSKQYTDGKEKEKVLAFVNPLCKMRMVLWA